ncbi:hypothetical protein BC831DRAFT_473499 [Entophlyctis helioformis]|nr:hypothetical protein BC831DRAFT_473499 [Entophlyctis helioformis]
MARLLLLPLLGLFGPRIRSIHSIRRPRPNSVNHNREWLDVNVVVVAVGSCVVAVVVAVLLADHWLAVLGLASLLAATTASLLGTAG